MRKERRAPTADRGLERAGCQGRGDLEELGRLLYLDRLQETFVRGPKLGSLVDIAVIARKVSKMDAVKLRPHPGPGVGLLGGSLRSDFGDPNQQ